LRLFRLSATVWVVSALTLDPDEDDLREGAAALVRGLRLLPGGEGGARPRLVGPDGEVLDVPPALFDLLVVVAEELERGNGVSVLPFIASSRRVRRRSC
jgi:hypothetical protein